MLAPGARGRVGGSLAIGVMVCLADRAVFTGTVGTVRLKRHSLVIPYGTIREVNKIEYAEKGRGVLALEVLADRRWGLLFLPKFDQSRDRELLFGRLSGATVPHWGNLDCDGALLDAGSRCPECGDIHQGVIAWTPADQDPQQSPGSSSEPDKPIDARRGAGVVPDRVGSGHHSDRPASSGIGSVTPQVPAAAAPAPPIPDQEATANEDDPLLEVIERATGGGSLSPEEIRALEARGITLNYESTDLSAGAVDQDVAAHSRSDPAGHDPAGRDRVLPPLPDRAAPVVVVDDPLGPRVSTHKSQPRLPAIPPQPQPAATPDLVAAPDSQDRGKRRRVAAAIAVVAVTAGAALLAVTSTEDETATYTGDDTIYVGHPDGLAVGEGAVWVTNRVDGTVSRIDPVSGEVTDTIYIGNYFPGPVTVGEGAVWVVNRLCDGTVSRIDPVSGEVTDTIPVGQQRYGDNVELEICAAGLAVGEGAVWVTNRVDGTVSRIDPVSGEVTDTIPVGGDPIRVAVGEGAVWVTDYLDGTVSRIDPVSREAADTAPSTVPDEGPPSPTSALGASADLGPESLRPDVPLERTLAAGATARFDLIDPGTDIVEIAVTGSDSFAPDVRLIEGGEFLQSAQGASGSIVTVGTWAAEGVLYQVEVRERTGASGDYTIRMYHESVE